MEAISGYHNTNRGLLNSAEVRSSVYLHTENTGRDLIPHQPIHKTFAINNLLYLFMYSKLCNKLYCTVVCTLLYYTDIVLYCTKSVIKHIYHIVGQPWLICYILKLSSAKYKS